MQIFICGLYRSGTTITWRTIAQDENLQSFDEPFNEFLSNLPARHHNHFGEEYLTRFHKNPIEFRNNFVPMLPHQDLKKTFSNAEKDYLKWLTKPYEAVNIDFTRCNFKLAELREMFPDALIIHLKRQPPAFVTSHLTTSFKAKGIKARLGRIYREKTFFTRKGSYNFYNYQTIIENYAPQEFDYLLPQLKNYQGQKMQDFPAYVKLLLLHRHNQNSVDKFSEAHPEKFLEWQFEEFAVQPIEHLKQIYQHFNQEMPDFEISHLRQPNLGHQPDSHKWDAFLS